MKSFAARRFCFLLNVKPSAPYELGSALLLAYAFSGSVPIRVSLSVAQPRPTPKKSRVKKAEITDLTNSAGR